MKIPHKSGVISLVQPVDAHSNKSALVPPPLTELERLAHQSRLLQPDIAPAKDRGRAVRSLRRRLAPQAIAELAARYEAGESTHALSRAYGISKTGLVDLLRAEGVSMRRQSITPKDAERAVRLYENSLTIDEVVTHVGYSYGTIRKALHESGAAMRQKGIKRSALNKD